MTWFAYILPCLTGRCVDELQAVNHTTFIPIMQYQYLVQSIQTPKELFVAE